MSNSMSSLRSVAKRALEVGLVRSGLTTRLARDPKRRRLILAYHNVVPDGDPLWGERSIHIRRSLFEGHIEALERIGRIVPLLELVTGSEVLSADRPLFALTFDDAYRGAVKAIRSILVPRGIPCTVFVNPGLMGHSSFWWDSLAQRFGGEIPAQFRQRCLEEFRGEYAKIRAWMKGEGMEMDLPASGGYRPPTRQDILDLHALAPRVQLGSHTWSHPNLSRLSEAEREDELVKSREWLESLGAEASSIVAYPYGLTDASVQVQARDGGYRVGLRVEGGHLSVEPNASHLSLPRLNVPAGLSVEGLMVRVSGLR